MLRDLLIRDWILNRRTLIPVAAIFGAFQVYFVLRANSARPWVVFACVYAAFLTLVPLTREDRFRAAGWSCTLPVTRADLVRARFAGAWILALGSVLLALIVAWVVPGSRISLVELLAPSTLLLAAAIVTFTIALMVPFTIRFGLLGVLVFLVVVQVLGAVMLLALASRGRQGASHGMLGGAFATLRTGHRALRGVLTPAGLQAAEVLGLVLVAWGGYRLAQALFRRREF